MGIGDSIGKAAENAMEDLAGTSEPTDDAHVPEPGTKDDDVQVHSSISEGSNAMDDDGDASHGGEAGLSSSAPQGPGPAGNGGSGGPGGSEDSADIGATETPDVPRDVAGSAGLPDPDPDELRADPSEGGEDPSTGVGRG